MKHRLSMMMIMISSSLLAQSLYYGCGNLYSHKKKPDGYYSPYVEAREVGTEKIIWREHDPFASHGRAWSLATNSTKSMAVTAGDYNDTLDLFGFRLINESNTYNAFIIKFNSEGKGLWYKTISGNYLSYIRYIEMADNGDILVSGNTKGLAHLDDTKISDSASAFILSLDSLGNINWLKTDEECLYGSTLVLGDTKEYFYWEGLYSNPNSEEFNASKLKKYDLDGNEIWTIDNNHLFLKDGWRSYESRMTIAHDGHILQGQMEAVPLVMNPTDNSHWKKELVLTKYHKDDQSVLFQKSIVSSEGLLNKNKTTGNMILFSDIESFADGSIHMAGTYGEDEITFYDSASTEFTARSNGRSDIWFVKLNHKGSLTFANWYGDEYTDIVNFIGNDGQKIRMGGCYYGDLNIGERNLSSGLEKPTIFSVGYEPLPLKTDVISNAEENTKNVKKVTVAPNPVKSNSMITLDLENIATGKYEIILADLKGKTQKVLNSFYFGTSQSQEVTFPLNNVDKGMYLLSIKNNDTFISSTKLVIQ